jgi:hypothetical protein
MTEKLNGAGLKIIGAVVLGFLLPTMYILGSASSSTAKAGEYDHEAIVEMQRNLAADGGRYTQNEADVDWATQQEFNQEVKEALGRFEGKLDLIIRLERGEKK